MKLHSHSFPFGRAIATSALVASLSFVGATAVRADDSCQKRTEKADKNLHEAAAKHGWDSPEAAKYREELNQARSYCWEHDHRWWSVEDRRWHTERDWDDHDHDHAPMDHPQL